MMNALWFILRRLIMVYAFVFIRSSPTLTVMVIFATQGFTIIYMISVHPYEDKEQQKTEMLHEFTFLICLYHILCFSEGMIDETKEAKYTIGFSLLGCLAMNILLNLGKLVFFGVKKLINYLKRCCK